MSDHAFTLVWLIRGQTFGTTDKRAEYAEGRTFHGLEDGRPLTEFF
jgi:hypothetical protein